MSFPLSLKPWPTKPMEVDPLHISIGRINEERGHFRNITEHSLQDEIERGPLTDSDTEVVDDGEKAQDVEARRTELYLARAVMLKNTSQAQNEALTALDFISLLISKDAPRQADISMSPFLKETIPAGTLAFDRAPAPKPNKVEEDAVKTVVTGWNLQSLNSAADKLLDSANRLEKEMEKEARYWEQVLTISDMGWSVCKMPRESHTIGVRFGFSEASPIFAARGLAALRPDSNGDIVLDQGLSHRPQSIRIQIARDGLILGTSSSTPAPTSQAGLEGLIHQARDSLFEEELFQEMIRESRNLLSYGVKILGNEIRFTARQLHTLAGISLQQTPLEVIIDQISPNEHIGGASSGDFDQLANGVAVALRLLLTNAYRHKFLARTRAPRPLSNEKLATPAQEIIRPVLCHFQHCDAMGNLQTFVTALMRTLRSAQLNASCSVDIPRQAMLPGQGTSAAKIQSLVADLDLHLVSTMKLNLPGPVTHAVVVTTQLSSQDRGTFFRLDLDPATQTAKSPLSVKFRDFVELREQLSDLTRQAVARHIAQQHQVWTLELNGRELRHIGGHRSRRLTVALQNEKLALVSSSKGEPGVVLAVWQGEDEGESTQIKSLDQVVKDANA